MYIFDSIFGIIFSVTAEALIICFVVSILKKYTGGAHAKSPSICATIGTIICISEALVIKHSITLFNLKNLIFCLSLFVFIWSYFIILKLVPVDSKAKPIRTEAKKKRMKKGSIFVLSAYAIVVVINLIIYFFLVNNKFLIYSLCILGGVVWQTFAITITGHRFVEKMDSFLSQILKFNRRSE